MKKTLLVTIGLLCGLLMAPLAHAFKVGYVDVQVALQKVKAAETARKEVEKEIAKRQEKLDKMRQELQNLEAAFRKQEMVLTEAKKQQKKEEFLKKAQKLQQELAMAQQDMQQVEQRLLAPILNNMSKVLETLSKKKGYDMVLTKNALLFADQAQDLTSDLIEAFNKKYKK